MGFRFRQCRMRIWHCLQSGIRVLQNGSRALYIYIYIYIYAYLYIYLRMCQSMARVAECEEGTVYSYDSKSRQSLTTVRVDSRQCRTLIQTVPYSHSALSHSAAILSFRMRVWHCLQSGTLTTVRVDSRQCHTLIHNESMALSAEWD